MPTLPVGTPESTSSMSSNFLQWNPTAANQESDSTYNADALRTGGATTGAILPSNLDNKFRFQTSTFVAALAQALANKGYNLSDAVFSTLVTVLSNIKTSADFPASQILVPYATSMVFDAAQSFQFVVALTGNVSAASLINIAVGQQLLFIWEQDGVGSRTFPTMTASGYTWVGQGAICPIASSVSLQFFDVVSGTGLEGPLIIPITPMMWLSGGGIITLTDTSVISTSVSGTVASGFREITEKVDASGGTVTRTFFSANPSRTGVKINIKKMDSSQNAVVPTAAGGQFIDGAFANFPISVQYNSLTFQCDGSGWILI